MDIVLRRFRLSVSEVWDVALSSCWIAAALDGYSNGLEVAGENYRDRVESKIYSELVEDDECRCD